MKDKINVYWLCIKPRISYCLDFIKNNPKRNILGIIVFIALIYVYIETIGSRPTVDFSEDVKPILNKHCIGCHGGVKKNGNFSILFEEEAFAKTKSGHPAIIPGDASNSLFIQRLTTENLEERMPYKKAKLSNEEISILTKWINQGAKWGTHWAYETVVKTKIPEIDNEKLIKNNIDNFILQKLEDNKLTFNKEADPTTLIRRLSLDLIGLPPTEQLLQSFTSRKISYEALVDTIIKFPDFGEKWASWWLDMAKYADTKGYEIDNRRNIWQYRDWVIKAFNKDLPFNDFVIEQLAGDLLPNPTEDNYIASAFNRNTMNNDEGGTDDEEFRTAETIDRAVSTFEVFQGTTMGCVQCHSHPYDPIWHKEFYTTYAFFNNMADEDVPGEYPNLKLYDSIKKENLKSVLKWIESNNGSSQLAEIYKNILLFDEPCYKTHNAKQLKNSDITTTGDRNVNVKNGGSFVMEKIDTRKSNIIYLELESVLTKSIIMQIRKNDEKGELLATHTIPKQKSSSFIAIPIKQIDEVTNLYFKYTSNSVVKPDSVIVSVSRILCVEPLPAQHLAGYKKTQTLVVDLFNDKSTERLPVSMDYPKTMHRTTQIFHRGNWLNKTDTVLPSTPKTLNAWEDKWPKNRLGLSYWLTDKKNPLLSRTIVNRVWAQIFGNGIVTTLEDMGTQSEKPTHKALLNMLSYKLMNDFKWSLKQLIKEIVLSATYRQSSVADAKLVESDPQNLLYARGPRFRLSAEAIRDQALMVAGLLSKKQFGLPVMPPQPDGIWNSIYSADNWKESQGEDKYRRGVYVFLKRTSIYPSFQSFDAPSREVCTIRRIVTNTPLQALITLNDPVFIESAYYLAKSVTTYTKATDGIKAMYKKALLKNINNKKLEVLNKLYQTSFKDFKDKNKCNNLVYFEKKPTAQTAAYMVVANAILNLDEFITKM